MMGIVCSPIATASACGSSRAAAWIEATASRSSIDGLDLRCEPIEERKAELARLLVSCRRALVVTRVFDAPVPDVFQHACKLGFERIVSKRRGSRYALSRVSLQGGPGICH
jgi:hypothetical protein